MPLKKLFLPLVYISILIILLNSCNKDESCSLINCNYGLLNKQTCKCDCPPGVLGTNCEKFDPTQIQVLLDSGKSPQTLFNGGIPLDSIYGKLFSGGYIYYLDTTNGYGLVAAQVDQSQGIDWGCFGTDIPDLENVIFTQPSSGHEFEVGARIGDGKSNTAKIIKACMGTNLASRICNDYFIGNNYDWFLPSRYELYWMRINLKAKGLGNFSNYKYWSSTELNGQYAWTQDFGSLSQSTDEKMIGNSVRAASSFSSNCLGKNCLYGSLNEFNCSCKCPEGFFGSNCEKFDPSKVQHLIDKWNFKPIELFEGGIPVDSLFGKMYEGGLIFYLDVSDGTGMVAAEFDQSNGTVWGCKSTNLGSLIDVSSFPPKTGMDTVEGSRIYDGLKNTLLIVNECSEDNIAAKICFELNLNGYVDWFLPSRAELTLMFTNLKERGYGNFNLVDFFYWSSTENSNFNAWIVGFNIKDTGPISKSFQGNIRAARVFY